jgi:hypothetical protein
MTDIVIANPGSDLPFPKSLPEFQRLFPNDATCATYLEGIRWPGGNVSLPPLEVRPRPARRTIDRST